MTFSRPFLPRRAVAILTASIATLCITPALDAETYYWDPIAGFDMVTGDPIGDDFLDGGTGAWNTADPNFTISPTDSSTVMRTVWSSAVNNAGTDSVIFGGSSGGIVTLNTFSPNVLTNSNSLGVNNLTFSTTGYTLQGTSTIRFIGTGASITVNSGVTATINNGISGGTLTGYTPDTDVEINGGGTLRMGGGNGSLGFTIAAGTTVEQTGGTFSGWNTNNINGTLRTLAANVLPAPSSYRDTDAGTGVLDLNGFGQTIGNLGGGLTVTNGSSANSISLGLTMTGTAMTHTGVISNGTGGGKISLFTTGTVAQGIGFQTTTNFNNQTFAGANTFTGSFTHGRGTVVLDFSNATAPASNIFYNSGFGATPAGDDGKLIFNRAVGTAGVSNSAVGTLATLQLTGKASTANLQQFSGLRLNASGAGQVYLNPGATGGTMTLDLGSSLERESGGFINFSTTNATTALSANATILSTAGTAGGLLTSADGVAFATLSGRDWAAKNATNDAIVAATYTSSTTNAFATGENISIPSAGGAGNDVRLESNTSIASLRYGNTSARSGIQLGGNTLTTGGILVSAASDSSGNFLSGGNVTSPGSDLVLAHFAGSSSRWFQMDAVIADGTAGATGFTKAGTGITVLSGDNTFTGELTSHQGGLIVTGTNDGASAVKINGSQTNLMGTQLPSNATSGSFIQIGNSGPAGTIGSGPVDIGGNAILAVKSSDSITINNTISGFGGFTQGGTGTTTLVSAATAKYTYVGDTTVTGGTLKLDYSASNTGIINDNSRLVLGGGTVEYATVAGTTQNDTVRGFALLSGASTITKTGTGAGRLRMNGVVDVGVAGSTVNFTADGVADTDIGPTNGIMGSRARFTVGSGSTFDWATQASNADSPVTAYSAYTAAATSGTNTSNSRLSNSNLTLTGNLTTNTLKVESTATGVPVTLDIGANTLTLTAGGLLVTGSEPVEINGGTLKSNTASNSDLIIHQYNSGGLTIGSVIANGTGNSTLTKSGSGTLTLTGANTYTGQTYLNGGTTIISSNAALGAPASGGQLNLNNSTLRVTDNVILSNGAVGTNNRQVVLNGVGGTLEVDTDKTLTIGGTISGPGTLTKTGLGTLEIRSNNSTGPTNVEAGTLKYTASIHNTYSALTVAEDATVDLFGFSNAIGSLAGAGTITNSGTAAATLTVTGLPTNTTFSGQLTQAGSAALHFEKSGPGVLTLTGGANNTTGAFTISGGTLVLADAAVFTTRTGTSAGAVSVNSATASLDISGITADSLTAGSIASVAGSTINLGSKMLIAGSNNGSTTLAGVISGEGGGLTKTSTSVGGGSLTITGVNTYTGQTIIEQGMLRIRDSVLVNTPGPLGNASSAIIVGSATSATGGQYSANLFLNVQPVGDNDHLTFARPIDFSQAPVNDTKNDRSRLRLESNSNGTEDTSKLTISGDITLASTNARSLELYVDKAGQTMEFTGNITGGTGGTIYLTGLANTVANGDGASGGTFRFSDMPRTLSSSISLTIGRAVIAGSVPATGPSPIGTSSITLGDGNGGNTLGNGAAAGNRGVFLETPGATYARGLSPGGGSNNALQAADLTRYGSGTPRIMNGHQFGGTNTTGIVTYTGAISPGSVPVSVTGTAGGLGGTNPVTTVHNLALIAATGGTVAFDGAISGSTAPVLGSTDTPGTVGSGNLARVTINQVRNHPNIDENRDGFADASANALVGTATEGTVVLNAVNTYGGTTEVLGGTLLVNGSIAGDSVTVASGATLGGSGSILAGVLGSTATINGRIAPGASTDGTGVLTLEKSVTLASGAALTLEINGTTAGENYDQLAIGSAGGITLAGDNPINLTLGYVPQAFEVLTLINNFSDNPIVGTFSNLVDDSVVSLTFAGNQYAFTVDYQGGTGNDLTLTAVPEPSAAVAVLAGVGMLLGVRRRRRGTSWGA